MSDSRTEVGAVVFRFIGKAVDGPRFLLRAVAVATVSLAADLVGLMDQGLADNLRQLVQSELQTAKGEADQVSAEAQTRLAEAAEASNRATLQKRSRAVQKAQIESQQAQIAKTQAEAEAIRTDADTRRIQAIAEANVRLVETIEKLRLENGKLAIDPENLQKIIDAGVPPLPPPENQGIGSHLRN